MRRASVPVAVVLALAPAVAFADEPALGAHARFEARYLRLTEAPTPPFADHVAGGLAIRAFAGHPNVGYAVGVDFELGATNPAGLVYAAHLRPVGVAFGDEGLRLSSTFGIGLDGVTSRLRPATRLPVDALLELPFEGCVKIELAMELAWLPFDETRQGGARAVSIADESALALRVRIDRRHDTAERLAANGYYVGLALAERHRGLLAGVSVGYSLDGTYGAR